MKIVLGILVLITNISFSQITINQGRWCITKYDENLKLKEIIFVQDSIIKKDSLQFIEYKKVFKRYKNDSVNYNKIIRNDSIAFVKKDQVIIAQSEELRKIKNNGVIKSGIIIVLLLISIFK